VIKGSALPADNGLSIDNRPACRAGNESDTPKGAEMKKVLYILTVLLIYGLVWFAQASQGALSPPRDSKLEAIHSQSRIVIDELRPLKR
jgi:hypothetical protein